MAKAIQPSFAKGEFGPLLRGRVDTAAYQVACRTLLNWVVHPSGGVSNRPGLTYLAPVMDHDFPSKLIDFQFKTTDSYVLEFGDQKMRVIRNDAHVTEPAVDIADITQADPGVVTATAHGYSDGDEVFITGVGGMTRLNGNRYIVANATTDTFELTDQVDGSNTDTSGYDAYTSGGTVSRIYTLDTPYLAEDLEELKWVQSADVMTLTHRDYPIKELTRTAHDNWTLTDVTFGPDVDFPRGITGVANTSGAVTYVYQVTALGAGTLEESLAGLNNTARTITAITQANPGVVTSNGHGFTNGQEVYIETVVGMVELNGRRFTVSGVTTNTFELQDIDTTGYTAYSSGGTANRTSVTVASANAVANNTISWTAVTGADSYNVYKFANGAYGLVGNTESTSFTDTNIAADQSVSPPRQRNPFIDGINPITCSYFRQRRVFGGSNDEPDTSWYTQTGNQDNMNASTPIQDDDAFNATLASRQVNEIRHFIPQTSLLVFTSGAEWKVDAGQSDHFSIDTIKQDPQSEWGSSHIRPIVVGNTILYVPEARNSVRNFGYSFQIDRYTGSNLTVFAQHLFENSPIKEWCYAFSPDSRVYAIREDGYAATLTYDQEQEVMAWTRWNTDGYFERTVAIKNPSGVAVDEDGVYFVVKRFINGRYVRYIERLHSRKFTEVEDCFFVDCGLSFDNPVEITNITLTNPVVITAPSHGFSNGDELDFSNILWQDNLDKFDNRSQPDQLNGYRLEISNVTTDTFEVDVDGTAWNVYVSGGEARLPTALVSGFDFIEGKEVVALADGNVVRNLTVVDGQVELARPASRIHIGLPYTCDLETLNLESTQGTMQGLEKKISTVILRFDRSRGMWYGIDPYHLAEMKQRENEKMGQPTALLTGDKELTIFSDWNSDGRVFLRQRDPLPVTILDIIPDVEVGG